MPPLEAQDQADSGVGIHETWWHKNFGWLARYLAEFMGTFLLSFTVTCNFSSESNSRNEPTWEPTSNACMLMVLVYSLGPISGAHLNPAISLAAGLANKGTWGVLCRYVLAQLLGGLCGGITATWIYHNQPRPDGLPDALGPHGIERQLHVANAQGPADCMLLELLFTCLLCFVYLNVTLARQNNPVQEGNHFYGIAVAFAYLTGGYSASWVSGAYFNPAVTIGIDVASPSNGVFVFSYILMQLLGGTLAALIFRIVRPAEMMEERAFRSYASSLHEKCLCEAFGAFFLMFVFGLNEHGDEAHRQIKPWACAAVVIAMVYAISDISGGHLNPAISIAVMATGRTALATVFDCAMYIVSQTVAAIIGALAYSTVYGGVAIHDLSTNRTCTRAVDGVIVPEPCTMRQVAMVEFIFSFVLVYAVLSTSVVKGIVTPLRRNYYYGIAIGMTVAAAGFAVGSVSGAVLNPSLAVGISFASLMSHGDFWLCSYYIAAHVSAGLFAVMLFALTHDEPKTSLLKKEEQQRLVGEGAAASSSPSSPSASPSPPQAGAAALLDGAQVKQQPKQGKQSEAAGPRGRRAGRGQRQAVERSGSPSPV